MKNISTKAIIHFILAIFFAIGASFLSSYFTNQSGKEFDANRLEEYLQSKEKWMQNFCVEIDQFLVDDTGFSLNDQLLNKALENNIFVFVYTDDSLIAWSNNNLLSPQTLRDDGTHFTDEHTCLQLEYVKTFEEYSYVLVFPVFYTYPYQNEFLSNRLNPHIGIQKEVQINLEKKGREIHDNADQYLFSIEFPLQQTLPSQASIVIFSLYVLSFIFFIAFLYLLTSGIFKKKSHFLIVWISMVVLFRIALQIFQVPQILYESSLFQPSTFAMNIFFPSLGDYFLHSLFGLFVVFILLREINIESFIFQRKTKASQYLIGLFFILTLFIFTDILFLSLQNLLLHSKINFDLVDPSNLNYLSVIGIVILILNSFIYITVTIRLLKLLKGSQTKPIFLIISFLVILVLHLLFSNNFEDIKYLYHGYILLYFGVLYGIIEKVKEAKITSILIGFIIIAIGFNNVIIHLNRNIEKNHRKSLIRDLSLNQDPEAEYLFNQVEEEIYSDTTLRTILAQEGMAYKQVEDYILEHYFKTEKHWDRYDFLLTSCDQYVDLIVKPQNFKINCEEFFYKQLLEFGRLTDSKNLYYLEYGTGQTNYLGLFRFEILQGEELIEYTIYLEINSRLKREGYSKLLTESGLDPFEKIQNYSLARYQNNSLMENYGKYSYPDDTPVLKDTIDEYEFWDKNGFSHLTYRYDSEHLYVLSKKNATGVSQLVPFSYLFVFMILVVILLLLLLNSAFQIYKIRLTYSSRLQLTIVVLLLIAFGIISGVSVYYIKGLDESSNQQKIKELARSLQTEFEHKVQKEGSLQVLTEDNMNTLAVKFSKVFNTDINLYTLDGLLLATTRNQIFKNALLSEHINPFAYNALTRERETFYVHKENIGDLEFYSAYLPFHDGNNNIVAYLNLPYFAKQNELRKDVSGFILALINIYTLIIVLSILAALLVSNYITRPLILIRNKMKDVQLGKSNEIITWSKDDEIGQLVKEYNRMIGELADSAELLAKSERASAWREMAQQVAHEIKNPLTPMRMSIQFLQRAWNDKAEDREERLERLLNTLIEQIDTLADIASAFSDFAKMPKLKNEVIDLVDVIHSSVDIHKGIDDVEIQFDYLNDVNYPVWGDKKHMIRVFNNLLKNSIQAFEQNKKGFIHIQLTTFETDYQIIVKDNGRGIPEELSEKIFVPNFTTKSSGTGLGLAMVKNIILSAQGSINFNSIEGDGTEFIIRIPLYQNDVHENEQ